ncbi:MAG TPA: hypothetical protein VF172_11465 [Nitrososphaera sp.]|jgi:hypothetical protein
MSTHYGTLCKQILALDKTIRFAGVADRFGKIIAYQYREGLLPLLDTKDSEKSIKQSAIRMSTRRTLEDKLGKTVYAFTMYEKVKRVTIPMPTKSHGEEILMVSFDLESNHEQIILEKIIPLIRTQDP